MKNRLIILRPEDILQVSVDTDYDNPYALFSNSYRYERNRSRYNFETIGFVEINLDDSGKSYRLVSREDPKVILMNSLSREEYDTMPKELKDRTILQYSLPLWFDSKGGE